MDNIQDPNYKNNEENNQFESFDFSEEDNSFSENVEEEMSDLGDNEDFEESRRSNKGIVISAVIIILILIGAYWFFISNPEIEKEGPIANNEEIYSEVESKIKNEFSSLLSVSKQLAGDKVIISSVELENDSWIAINEKVNGELGNILGALWLPAGKHSDVEVELLRSTESGKSYFAVIRSDNGDKEFDHEIDLPLEDENGNILVSSFEVL